MGFYPIRVVSANITSISEAEAQLYCLATSGYAQEAGKLSPTVTIDKEAHFNPHYSEMSLLFYMACIFSKYFNRNRYIYLSIAKHVNMFFGVIVFI